MGAKFVLIFVSACLATLTVRTNALGLSCKDHPAYFAGLKSTLPKSWRMLSGPDFGGSNYHVNPPSHQYAPLSNVNSTKYKGLDLFWAYQTGEGEDFIELEFQRPAKVYILVAFEYNGDYPEPILDGWRSEEYVGLVKGIDEDIPYGVHQTNYRWIPREAYAFSKLTTGKITLPAGKWVQSNIRGGTPTSEFMVLVAEEDGSAPSTPTSPEGVPGVIEPGARCPDELHDLWVTDNTDDLDEDTKGMKWATWHPMWDPCYWWYVFANVILVVCYLLSTYVLVILTIFPLTKSVPMIMITAPLPKI